MNLLKSLDSVWAKRSTSIIGFAIAALGALASAKGQVVLTDIHVPADAIKFISDIQGFLDVLGPALMARGVAVFGPSPKDQTN